MYKLSVIVPVYKVEKYLENCVRNLLAQADETLQIILVDDGSPDRCGEICDALAQADARIQVIHKQNGGLSDARNAGIRQADGDYLLFLDPDDQLLPEAISRIRQILEQRSPDVVIGQYKAVQEETGRTLFERDCVLQKREIESGDRERVFRELWRAGISPCAWRYVVRKVFLEQNQLYFADGLLCEDTHWTPRLLCAADTFALNEQPFYEYNVRAGSIMTTANFKRTSDLLRIARENFVFAQEMPPMQRGYVFGGICLMLNSALQDWKLFSPEQRKQAREWFAKNRTLVRQTGKARVAVRLAQTAFGGFYGTLLGALWVAHRNRRLNG